jgi:5'-nucleotidase / UDP-sugar diphosphatase
MGRASVTLSFVTLWVTVISGCVVRQPEVDLRGQDVPITVVHTSDIHSRFFPYFFAPGQIDRGLGLVPKQGSNLAVVGGISRMATVAKCIRGLTDSPVCKTLEPLVGPPAFRSLHFDSGDIFQGAPVFNVFSGEVEVRTMTQLGLSTMVIGNHEFDRGVLNFQQQVQQHAGFPFLAANYAFPDPREPSTTNKLGLLVPPYMIFNVGGVKVGVIGMANLSSIQGIIEGGNSLGIRPYDTKQTIELAAKILRPQVDVLTVVSHMGLEEDEDVAANDAADRDENQQLVLKEIDVIFGGHLHIVLNPPKDLPQLDPVTGENIGHTILCHSGAFAKYMGRLDLIVHMPTDEEKARGERARIKAYTYRVVPISDSIPEDPDLVRTLEPYQFAMNRNLDLTQVFALVPCPKNVAACPKTLRNDPAGGDSQLGNLVATSMRLRRRVEADFALTNSLGIRADFESGPLNLEQMFNVFPFENTIATMFLSGTEVQDMLDFVARRSSERGCRTQAQVAGIFFDMVCGRGDPECARPTDMPGEMPLPCAKNIFLGDNCRRTDGTIDDMRCKPLQPFAQYRVAVNDYIAQGGSGFAVLKRNTTKFNTGISLRDSLIDYIRTLDNRCDPAQYDNVTGVTCRDTTGTVFDCTARCCCHDAESGPFRCSTACQPFKDCQNAAPPLSPKTFDYSNAACLPADVEAHEGRINPIAGATP